MRVSRPDQSRVDPERWSDRPSGGSSLEDLVGEAIGCVREAPVPVGSAGRWGAARLSGRAARGLLPRWRLALVAALLLAASGGAIAGRWLWAPVPAPQTGLAPAQATVVVVGPRVSTKAGVAPAAPAPVAPAVAATPVPASSTPPLAVSEVPRRAHPRAVAAVASVPAAASATGSPPVPDLAPAAGASPAAAASRGESEVLARAFRALRAEHDPDAALAALDEYRHRFPTGALRGEATLARLESLLATGRKRAALALVSGAEADGVELTRDMRLSRAELLSEAGRCSEAMNDFDRLVGGGVAAARPNERALYGRATCRLRAGDQSGARQDLERYLAAYPRGRFHADAALALASIAEPRR